MDWNVEGLMALRVVIASALGGFIGWEREQHGREAGIRTYGAVALGACVCALISTHVTTGSNPHVIAAGVVTGVGFLGAGVIMREQGSIVGLTTAATLWATASVGLAIGYGMYVLGMLTHHVWTAGGTPRTRLDTLEEEPRGSPERNGRCGEADCTSGERVVN